MKFNKDHKMRIGEAISMVSTDEKAAPELKRDIIDTLSGVMNPLDSDRWIYRLVVLFLGLTVLVVTVGGIIAATKDVNQDLPTGIIALGSMAGGALAGLLAPSPQRGGEKE